VVFCGILFVTGRLQAEDNVNLCKLISVDFTLLCCEVTVGFN